MNKRTFGIIGALLLLISGTALAVLPERVSWNYPTLTPASIAPGTSVSFSVALTHTGILPIPATNQLKVLPSAELLPYVTVTPPVFPPIFKRGNSVNVVITVRVPQGTPLGAVKGNLTLNRILPNGKVMEVWRANALPTELTFSSFFIPPAPDKAFDESTIKGVDSDANGVPDRADRFIAFVAPDSEKKRMAMTLSAKAEQFFVLDYLAHKNDDPVALEARVKENDVIRGKGLYCLLYIYGANHLIPNWREAMDVVTKNIDNLNGFFINTPDRLRNFKESERPLVATGYPDVSYENRRQECLDLGFDPDNLPN